MNFKKMWVAMMYEERILRDSDKRVRVRKLRTKGPVQLYITTEGDVLEECDFDHTAI